MHSPHQTYRPLPIPNFMAGTFSLPPHGKANGLAMLVGTNCACGKKARLMRSLAEAMRVMGPCCATIRGASGVKAQHSCAKCELILHSKAKIILCYLKAGLFSFLYEKVQFPLLCSKFNCKARFKQMAPVIIQHCMQDGRLSLSLR